MPKKFTTSYINATFERLPTEFNNFKIALVADLHNANFSGELEKAVIQEKPDIIAIAGDFVSFHNHIQNGVNFIKSVSHIAPVLYVNGNHEWRFKRYDLYKKALVDAGAIALENEVYNIVRDNSTISFLGISDPKFFSREKGANKKDNFKKEILNLSNSLEKDRFKILLTHRPEFFKFYASCNIDLSLAGHAHGGQIRLPKIGALFADGQGFFPKYADGHKKIGNSHLVASRGLGHTFRTPPRVFNKRELVFINILKQFTN